MTCYLHQIDSVAEEVERHKSTNDMVKYYTLLLCNVMKLPMVDFFVMKLLLSIIIAYRYLYMEG